MERDPLKVMRTAMVDQVPDSTIDGTIPELRCENCRFWGKGNNITVCRRHPWEAALIPSPMGGVQPISMYPPALANEWCGEWRECGDFENEPGRKVAVMSPVRGTGAIS